jgi:hypothetical protein
MLDYISATTGPRSTFDTPQKDEKNTPTAGESPWIRVQHVHGIGPRLHIRKSVS